LYELVGGKLSDLPAKMDGKSQVDAIRKGRNLRRDLLYWNILHEKAPCGVAYRSILWVIMVISWQFLDMTS